MISLIKYETQFKTSIQILNIYLIKLQIGSKLFCHKNSNNLLIILIQAVLTTRIAPDHEILHKTKVSNYKTNYILPKKRSLQKKHKAKFISLKAAKAFEPACCETYFAMLHNGNLL